MTSERSIHVLHVIESLGGGVTSAVRDYLRSTPHIRHTVVARRRLQDDTGENFLGLADAVIQAPGPLPNAVHVVGQTFNELRPEVVHAHSSFAGVWARLARIPTQKIVYTPHCFGFERQDISSASRYLLRSAEAILARRTAVVAGVSPREVELARELRRAQRTTYLPNIARVPAELIRPSRQGAVPLTVATAGRVGAQKDPGFFAAVARALAGDEEPPPKLRWIGGGDDGAEAMLRRAGVDVTGWIPREQVLTQLSSADVYLHTAAWEGAPIAVLEAASLGIPIVARRIPALVSLGLDALADTPDDVAALVHKLQDPAIYAQGVEESQRLAARHGANAQAEALNDLYLLLASEAATGQQVSRQQPL